MQRLLNRSTGSTRHFCVTAASNVLPARVCRTPRTNKFKVHSSKRDEHRQAIETADKQREATKEPSELANNSEHLDQQQPTFDDGINWWCYSVLGLIFLTDFTPLGSLLRNASNGIAALAALQWGVFFTPTVAWMINKQWPAPTLLLGRKHPTTLWVCAGLVAGVVVYFAVATAIAAKSGVPLDQLQGISIPGVNSDMLQTNGAAQNTALGTLAGTQPTDLLGFIKLWGLAALSPAVCEEFLFRGFLLAALQSARPAGHPPGIGRGLMGEPGPSLGRIDAVFVAGMLFSAAHLDLNSFFSLCILGFACGGLATASGSVIPAIAAHASYNTVALLLGLQSS